MNSQFNRRRFLQTGMATAGALAASTAIPFQAAASLTKAARDPFDGVKLGMASYTYHNFTLDQAIAMTKQAGLKYINLKDAHLAMKSTPEQRREAHQKVVGAGLTLMGCGVVYMNNNNEGEIRAVFEYARDASMPTIVCCPIPAALDTVEKMVKEFDIPIAIHNHGPDNKDYPSPLDALKLVKDRDPRMGVCMDVGHTVRIGVDPIMAIQQCGSRLRDMHIKDVTAATPQGKPIEVGKGVIDIVAVFKALIAERFSYHVGLEYEANADNPQPGVLESVAYMRGVLAAI